MTFPPRDTETAQINRLHWRCASRRRGNCCGLSRVSTRDSYATLRCLSVLGWCLCIIVGLQLRGFGDEPENGLRQLVAAQQAIQQVSQRAEGNVVVVALTEQRGRGVRLHEEFDSLFQHGGDQLPVRLGLGVVLPPQGAEVQILTLAHLLEPVVRPARRGVPPLILVRLLSGETFEATLTAADPRSDLAVLNLKSDRQQHLIEQLRGMTMTTQTEIEKGTFTILTGNPAAIVRDRSASVGVGLVTNVGRTFTLPTAEPLAERSLHDLGLLLEISRPAPFVASGHPLLSLQGELLGLTTALSGPFSGSVSTSLAIPLTPNMQRVVEDLREGYEVEYGFLGIGLETSFPGELAQLGLDSKQQTAPLVTRISTGSPAEQAGLRRDDLILRVQEQIVSSSEELMRTIGLLPPDSTAELVIFRQNAGIQRLNVRLGKWPVYDDSLIYRTQTRSPSWRGLTIDYSTGRRRYLPDRFLTRFPTGVAMASIVADSPAAQAGLEVGGFIVEVEGTIVSTPREFHELVDGRTDPITLKLGDGREVVVP